MTKFNLEEKLKAVIGIKMALKVYRSIAKSIRDESRSFSYVD